MSRDTQPPHSHSREDPGQALYVWLAGVLGRPLTQDEADQLMVLVRAYVLATVKELQRQVKADPGEVPMTPQRIMDAAGDLERGEMAPWPEDDIAARWDRQFGRVTIYLGNHGRRLTYDELVTFREELDRCADAVEAWRVMRPDRSDSDG